MNLASDFAPGQAQVLVHGILSFERTQEGIADWF